MRTTSVSRSSVVLCLATVLVLLAVPGTSAAQAIYRCEKGGKVTYTDAPCDRPLIRSGSEEPNQTLAGGGSGTVVGGGYENPYGPWRGEAQYHFVKAGLSTDRTHSVVPLVLEIQHAGKVVGASAENRCKLLGVASPGLTPKILNLDVTLSDCAVRELNQRFAGSLSINSADRSARLSLIANRAGIGTAAIADIKATMRR